MLATTQYVTSYDQDTCSKSQQTNLSPTRLTQHQRQKLDLNIKHSRAVRTPHITADEMYNQYDSL